MAVSLLGYFGYVGAAFTAIMALLFSLLVDSSALEETRHYPRPNIVRTVTASNEAHRRLLKREANRQALRAFAAKEALPPKSVEQSHVSFTAQAEVDNGNGKEQADVDIAKSEKRSNSHKSKKLLASRHNAPTGGRHAPALSYAAGPSFAERRYRPFGAFVDAWANEKAK